MRTRSFAATTLLAVCVAAHVNAQAPPPFAIPEFGSGNLLKLEDLRTTTVAIPLTVEERAGTAARGVEVRLTDFVSAHGIRIHQGPVQPFDLKAGGQHALTITAHFPIEGTYKSTVRVVSAGKVTNIGTIELKRVLAAPRLDMPDFPAAVIRLDALRQPVSANFETTFYPRGESIALEPPLLHSFLRREKNDSEVSFVERGSLELLEPKEGIALDGRAGKRVRFRLDGIVRPGRYDAKIRFRSTDSAVVEKTATVYARDPWWKAAVWILLGVIAAVLLRAWGATVRPRLMMQRRVAGLSEQLAAYEAKAENDAPSLRLVRALQAGLQGRTMRLSGAGGPAGTAELDVFDTLVPAAGLFVDVRRQLKSVPDPLRQTFEEQLDEPERVLSDPMVDAAAAKTQTTAIAKTSRDAQRAIAVDRQIRDAMTELEGNELPVLANVRKALAEARATLRTGKVGEAEKALRDAARAYAEAVISGIEAEMDGGAPASVTPLEWNKLADDIREARQDLAAATDPDKARAIVNRALQAYVELMTRALQTDVGADPRYKELGPAIHRIKGALDDRRPADAWAGLTAARARYQELQPVGAGAKMGAESVAGAAGMAPELFNILDALFTRDGSAADAFTPGATKRLDRVLDRWDALAALLIFIVATLIGIQFLWADDLTWGGWKACLAAFLWGFAFDQFTHSGVLALLPKKK